MGRGRFGLAPTRKGPSVALSIQFAPFEDKGTGEVDHAVGPTTHVADDITNEPTGEVEHVTGATHTADAVAVESTGEHDTAEATTHAADWPRGGEDKAVTDGEAKAAPAKKAPARKAAAKKED